MGKQALKNTDNMAEHTGEEIEEREGNTVWSQEQAFDAKLKARGEKVVKIGDLDLEELVEVMSWQILPLRQQARNLLDAYWAEHVAENKKRPYSEKSIMGCRMRTKGDSIYLEWFTNRWIKQADGTSKPFSTYLKRGKNMAHSPATLLRNAREWEVELILSTEAGFALVRRQNHFLSLARQNVREAKKSQDKSCAE